MKWMIEDVDFEKLLNNHRQQLPLKGTRKEIDFVPVVQLVLPNSRAGWLLTECNEEGLAFGLCDLGHGTPELGYVDLNELAELEAFSNVGEGVQQDSGFETTWKLSTWAQFARTQGGIQA